MIPFRSSSLTHMLRRWPRYVVIIVAVVAVSLLGWTSLSLFDHSISSSVVTAREDRPDTATYQAVIQYREAQKKAVDSATESGRNPFSQ